METCIQLQILKLKYANLRKIEDQILKNDKKKDPKLENEIQRLIYELSQTIEKGTKSSQKFRICIKLGSLVSPYSSNKNCQVIYNGNEFTIHPKEPNEIGPDNFIVNNYSYNEICISFIDENGMIFSPKQYFNSIMLDGNNTNEITFLGREMTGILKNEITILMSKFIKEIADLSNEKRLQLGIYREKMEKQRHSTGLLIGLAVSEILLNDLNILSFNELISESILKLFKGEILTDIEKIVISRLTEKQIVEILNSYIQSHYTNEKLDNYLRNVREINRMIGLLNFVEHKEPRSNIIPFSRGNCINSTFTDNQNNIIEVDFVKKRK